MRMILITTITLAWLPAISHGQSDLQKLGQFLQDVQRIQNQNQGHQHDNGQHTPRSAPYKSNPNSSGNMNAGGFQNNNLFGPQGGGFDNHPNHNHNNYPYQNQNHFQQGHNHNQYPNNYVTPGYNTYPGNSYNNGIQTYPGSSRATARPSYSQPPIAPKVYSNLPIVIRCSPACTGICNYSLVSGSGKSFPYTIRAGQTQNLSENTDWKFRYQPTGGASQTYALRGGNTYELRQDGSTWQFYLVP